MPSDKTLHLVARTLIVLALAISSCGVAACGVGKAPSAAPTAPDLPAAEKVESEPKSTEVLMPEDLIDRMYAAAADGDLAEANSYISEGAELTQDQLDAWGAPQHQISGSTGGKRQGDLLMEVTETGGGLTGGGPVTFTIRSEQGYWRIAGWEKGSIVYPEPEPPTAEEPAFDQDKALVAVSSWVAGRMIGDIKRMKSVSTERMQRAQPRLFKSAFGSLIGVSATSTRREGDKWVVEVKERWESGDRAETYVVVWQGGKALLDEQR